MNDNDEKIIKTENSSEKKDTYTIKCRQCGKEFTKDILWWPGSVSTPEDPKSDLYNQLYNHKVKTHGVWSKEKCGQCHNPLYKISPENENRTFYTIVSEVANPNYGEWDKTKNQRDYKENIKAVDLELCESCWNQEQDKYIDKKEYTIF